MIAFIIVFIKLSDDIRIFLLAIVSIFYQIFIVILLTVFFLEKSHVLCKFINNR